MVKATAQKILLIEDETALLYALQAQFRLEGFDVEATSDGEQALKILKTQVPDIILLDILLPRVDGWELLQQIHADARLVNVPVVIISNLTDKESKRRGLELGAKAFLIKSDYDLDELVEKVKVLLNN